MKPTPKKIKVTILTITTGFNHKLSIETMSSEEALFIEAEAPNYGRILEWPRQKSLPVLAINDLGEPELQSLTMSIRYLIEISACFDPREVATYLGQGGDVYLREFLDGNWKTMPMQSDEENAS